MDFNDKIFKPDEAYLNGEIISREQMIYELETYARVKRYWEALSTTAIYNQYKIYKNGIEADKVKDNMSIDVPNVLNYLVNQMNEDFAYSDLTFYHSSANPNLEKSGIECNRWPAFFTLNKNYALDMANFDNEPSLYACNLQLLNPFDLSEENQVKLFNGEFMRWILLNKRARDPEFNRIQPIIKKVGDKINCVEADFIFRFLKENNFDYDSLIVDEGITWGKYLGILSFVPFNQSQIMNLRKIN